MKWFRLYHETPTDPKLRRIAHQAGATVGHVLAVWVSMLSHASQNEGQDRGTLAGWDDTDCAINLGIDRAIVFAIRREMEGRTLDGSRVIAWAKRQAQSDNTTARWHRWNEKRREENQGSSSEPTLAQRGTNVGPTSKRRREEKREDEIEESPTEIVGGVGGDAQRVAPRQTRGTRLPQDWFPSGSDQTFAREQGLDPIKTADSFRDYWHAAPGAKGVKLDWSATWRNWCRRDAEPRRKVANGGSKLGWVLDPTDPIWSEDQ